MSRFFKAAFFALSVFAVFTLFGVAIRTIKAASGASLYLAPSSGTYVVGSTFTVSVLLNTNGNTINALQADLSFPPDKLQLVSPSLGYSVVSVWTNQPKFDNQKGTISFQGGIPNPGINADRGVVATVTFRVKSVGQALVRFLDTSKVLLNDGLATDILSTSGSAIYDLTLPPPRGPIVVSETHADQNRWYSNDSALLLWSNSSPVEGYSYVINTEPIDIPDDISEGVKHSMTYRSLSDGTHFFHIKALRGGVWGETTHFAIKIDATPPADFPLEISPSARTSNRRPLIIFLTTDAASGLDHYEIKIVPREIQEAALAGPSNQPFFTEVASPYSAEFQLGSYDIIVRAYDKAGNFRDVSRKVAVVTPILQIIGFTFLPKWLAIVLQVLLLAGLGYAARRVWIWHREIHLKHLMGAVRDPEIAAKLRELKDRKSRYLKHLALLLMVSVMAFSGIITAQAQSAVLAPPLMTTIAGYISNEEILYVGGKSASPGASVVIYLQSLQDSGTISETVTVDSKGDWFYSFPRFLSPGQYLVWTQLKAGNQFSAPSAQREITVAQTAFEFGSSRLSYETLYLMFSIILLIALLGAIGSIVYHGYHGKAKHAKLKKEMAEAEEAIKKGFLLLHKDLQAELAVINKQKEGRALTGEDKEKERQLVRDLEWVSSYIEKEVRDIDRLLGA